MRNHAPLFSVLVVLSAAGVACDRSTGSSASAITYPGYAGHARWFPLVGGPHAGIDCNACHGAFDTFAKVDCVTCHLTRPTTPDAIHVGVVAGYVSPTAAGAPASPWPYSRDMCLSCHPTGSGSMANHGQFFPIGAGTSHALGCSQCHGAPKQDLARQQCAACHVANDAALASAHASAAIGKDYSASAACGGGSASSCPQSCLGCHAQDLLQPVASHPSISASHQGATCLGCHDLGFRTDLVASPLTTGGAAQPYAIDFAKNPADCANLASRTGCYTCHDSCPPGGN